ncbi:hypothetical protein D3C83_247270 [compost metagenome]
MLANVRASGFISSGSAARIVIVYSSSSGGRSGSKRIDASGLPFEVMVTILPGEA